MALDYVLSLMCTDRILAIVDNETSLLEFVLHWNVYFQWHTSECFVHL